ncbi:MAG TPA: 4-hydroxybenzoate 3-monooxygenase [Lacisediminihabitans sp.]|nr:4-hydroxybenzoate 3-monooxygenase [Lacisediminihabitans sp.]HXD62490.1 4-hydroxybenzoate 3-monooxygenase [Lacisediminihabitans sp.]
MTARTSISTRIAIVGGGPAGLLLSHLLRRSGIENVVLELRDREYAIQRVRAGVLENDAAQLLTDVGLGERLHREGERHDGIYLQYAGQRHHVPFRELVGRSVWLYSQQEVVKDLIEAHDEAGTPPRYGVSDIELAGLEGDGPATVRFSHEGEEFELSADFVVGADGAHGVCRPSIPESAKKTYEREYPFGWLGILAHVAPSTDELIYSLHERGFAMHSMRSHTVSRLYLQVDPHDDVANWPDERIWEELDIRLGTEGWTLHHGEIFDKSITPMRSFVSDPMRFGKLFLAGDSAHIVPPTGAKGLNLALADASYLHDVLVAWYRDGDGAGLDEYSPRSLERVWKIQHFSTWMTRMLHRFSESAETDQPGAGEFDYQVQLGQLRQLCTSDHGMAQLAEVYTGLPFLTYPSEH